MSPLRVELLTTGLDCALCARTERDLVRLGAGRRFELVVVDLGALAAPPPGAASRAPLVRVAGRLVAEGDIDRASLARHLETVLGGGKEAGGQAAAGAVDCRG